MKGTACFLMRRCFSQASRGAGAKHVRVLGVGINDADYTVYKTIYELDNSGKKRKGRYKCPLFTKWYSMMYKCYATSPSIQRRRNEMEGGQPSVCAEWHMFSNFRHWLLSLELDEMEISKRLLDKDIVQFDVKEVDKMYSPSTCLLVTKSVFPVSRYVRA